MSLGRAASFAALTLALAAGGGCAIQPPPQPPPAASTDLVSFESLPGWTAEHVADAIPVVVRGCQRLALTPPDQKLGGGEAAQGRGGQAGDWLSTCAAARQVPPSDEAAARAFLQTHFDLVPLNDLQRPAGLFTGYYEPEVRGSREETRTYHVAVRSMPADLIRQTDGSGNVSFGRMQDGSIVPYYTRAEIDHGAIGRQRLDLLYLQSQIDLFFLQIQGSGRISLPNGHLVRVGYAASNGQPYSPLGRYLQDTGRLPGDAMSAQTIRAWLLAHPHEAMAAMETNAAYTFFREIPGLSDDLGPIGTLGVQLTPMRSVAIDPRYIPIGAPVWIDTQDPDGKSLQRLMLAQDTGSGIKGSVRADIFFGWGDTAEDLAGRMQSPGKAWLLRLKQPASP